MKRLTAVIGLLVLAGCSESPTQPSMNVPAPSFTQVYSGGFWTENFEASPSGCEAVTAYPDYNVIADAGGLAYTADGGSVVSGVGHSGSCYLTGTSLHLQNGTGFAWTSLWVRWPEVTPPDAPWMVFMTPVDASDVPVFVVDPTTGLPVFYDQTVSGSDWTEVTLPPLPAGATGWVLNALTPSGDVWFDDLTYSGPPPVTNDPTTKDQCKKGGFADFGFRNQGQCIRFVETGKDSR